MANQDILLLAGLGVLGFFAIKQFSKPIGDILGGVSGAVGGVSAVVQGVTGVVSGGLKAVTEIGKTNTIVSPPVTSDGKLDATKLNLDISTLNLPKVEKSEYGISANLPANTVLVPAVPANQITYPYVKDGYEYYLTSSGALTKRQLDPVRGNASPSYSNGKQNISIAGTSYDSISYNAIFNPTTSGGSSKKNYINNPTMSDLKTTISNATAPANWISGAYSAVGKAKDPIFGF